MKLHSSTSTLWQIMAIALLLLPNLKAEEPVVKFKWVQSELLLTIEFSPEQDVWIRQSSHVGDYPENGKFGSLTITLVQNGRDITSQAFTHRITGVRAGSEFSSKYKAGEEVFSLFYLGEDIDMQKKSILETGLIMDFLYKPI